MAIFIAGDGIVFVCLFVLIYLVEYVLYVQCMNVQFILVQVLFIVLHEGDIVVLMFNNNNNNNNYYVNFQ